MSAADLHLDVQAQARVAEGHLVVMLEARLSVDRPGRLDLTASPLTLPLLAPLVRDSVLDRVWPAATQSLDFEAEGDVKVERLQGALQVHGAVTLIRPGLVRVRYAVAFTGPRLDLGLTGRAARTTFALAVAAEPPVRVRLDFDRPARVSSFEQGRERLVGASLATPLAPGQVLQVVVADLPATPGWPRRTLGATAGLAVLAALALILGRRPAAAVADAADRG